MTRAQAIDQACPYEGLRQQFDAGRSRARIDGASISEKGDIRASRSEALADGQDLSLGILEPRRLGPTAGRDAVPHRTIALVLLEHDAPRLELGHLSFDVVDLPGTPGWPWMSPRCSWGT